MLNRYIRPAKRSPAARGSSKIHILAIPVANGARKVNVVAVDKLKYCREPKRPTAAKNLKQVLRAV
jgi:hypothetical protein